MIPTPTSKTAVAKFLKPRVILVVCHLQTYTLKFSTEMVVYQAWFAPLVFFIVFICSIHVYVQLPKILLTSEKLAVNSVLMECLAIRATLQDIPVYRAKPMSHWKA